MDSLSEDLLILASTFLSAYHWKIYWTSNSVHWLLLTNTLRSITLDDSAPRIMSKLHLKHVTYIGNSSHMFTNHPSIDKLLRIKLPHTSLDSLQRLSLDKISLVNITISSRSLQELTLSNGLIDNLQLDCPQLTMLKCDSMIGIVGFLLTLNLYKLQSLVVAGQLSNVYSNIDLRSYTNLTKLSWATWPHSALTLSCNDQLRELYLEGVSPQLTHLTNLVRLTLLNAQSMILPATSNLKHLRLGKKVDYQSSLELESLCTPTKTIDKYFPSLTALIKLTAYSLSIEYISLTYLDVIEYHPVIESLTNLTKLIIRHNTQPRQNLASLTKLFSLEVMYDNVVYPTNLRVLRLSEWLVNSHISHLRLLTLTCKLSVDQTSAITLQTDLVSLNITYVTGGQTLECLSNLINLRNLTIRGASSRLPKLTQLMSLRIGFLNCEDISCLEAFVGLTKLDIETIPKWTKLPWLVKLTNLENLKLPYRCDTTNSKYPKWLTGAIRSRCPDV